MRLRSLLPLALLLLAAGGSTEGSSGQPSGEETYYCGSYESVAPGTIVTKPPC
ncbi:MAG: hypothetical protein H7323_01210 [Frankiales bacterium]|nr:hypothetical protein [Frankiales bacterium]